MWVSDLHIVLTSELVLDFRIAPRPAVSFEITHPGTSRCTVGAVSHITCTKQRMPRSTVVGTPPPIVDGTIDLSGWDFEHDGPVELKGEWLFAWDKFSEATPWEELRVELPHRAEGTGWLEFA